MKHLAGAIEGACRGGSRERQEFGRVIVDRDRGCNVVLSIYGKDDGRASIASQLAASKREGSLIYERNGSAGSVPKPDISEETPSTPGPIPLAGSAKPSRRILTKADLVKKSFNRVAASKLKNESRFAATDKSLRLRASA